MYLFVTLLRLLLGFPVRKPLKQHYWSVHSVLWTSTETDLMSVLPNSPQSCSDQAVLSGNPKQMIILFLQNGS